MTHLLPTALAVIAAAVVLAGHHVRQRATGRRWLPLREAMLHDAATLPSTYLAQIHTHPEPEAGGVVMATDLINGARGPLMLPCVAFNPGSVVCFTWTAAGPQIRAWMSGRLWRATGRSGHGGRPVPDGSAQAWPGELEIRTAADQVVVAAEQILRDQPQG